MSKHNGYMIGKQRLSKLTRPRLMALAVKLHEELTGLGTQLNNEREDGARMNNLLEAAVEAGENIRGDRDQEREYSAHWKNEAEMARGHVATQSTLIDSLETELSQARARNVDLVEAQETVLLEMYKQDKVARERLKCFCVNFTFFCTIAGVLAGATVAWLGAWAAFQ